SFYSANGSRVFVNLCNLKAKDETILSPAAEYRKCHSPLARENFGDFPGSRKTRVINFVVLPTLGGKRPSAVGESSPAIIRPQTTPAVMTKSKLSDITVRRRTRSSGEELPERPPAKQQRYPDSGSEDGPGGGDASGGQFSDGLSVHFTVIPDEERLLLVDQNEDRQVTSLVQKLLCGETFKPEDFPGGDESFFPKLKVLDAAQEEGACPTPVRQRNLRPRNTAPFEVENISSSGNSGEENRQCSERCRHENLKHWISQRFEGMENSIEELRTLICKSLGLPEGSERNAWKRKAMDDPQVRRTLSPDDSIVSETEGRNRKGKKRKTVGTRLVGKKTLPRRRSGGGKEEVSRKNPPSSERESGHQNDDDHAKENESDNARFPPSGGNKGDQQQETQSNALVLFGDVLDVEPPESYVLPAEHAVTSPGAWQKRNPTYRYEQGSPVAWEKTKPNCYSSVGSVRFFHPSWDGNPSSKYKGKSAPEGGEGHQKWVGAPPVGYESGQTSNQNDGERLEQVYAPMGFVEALVKEINSEIPGSDGEIRATRGGEGAQPKENESVAARMTPTTGIDFAQKTGADNGGESGQTSNQNDGERLEQVSAPMGFVEALVKEINSEIPGGGGGADEEIRATRGGEGAQPKENESVAARMTPTAGIDFTQKTGADNGGEFVEEDPDGGEEARTADKQPQSVDSVETSNMEISKPVEAVGKVAPPKAGVEASVKEINAKLQGTEDEERYDSCKDDMSTDSQIQENPRDLCGETDADSEDVGSGGKRHRMRSSKISGVYTPDPRVKKLFKSEEKVEYKPIAKTNRTQFKKFPEILRENPEQMWDIATGHSVCNHFFFEIAEPGKLMSDEETINCWISEGRSRKVVSAIIARLCFQRCANDVQNSVIIVSGRRQAKDHKKTPTSDPNSMEAHVLPNLPQEIVCKIIELVGEESFYNIGPFLRAEKRGYALAHEPSVLKKCDVSEMEDGFVTCQIRQGCQFREFHLKCVSAGNRKAIYYEGLFTAPSIGFEETVAIFNVCLGNDKEASKVFQLFAAYHHDLRSDDTCEMGESIENQLKAFGAEDLNCNKYGEFFKFPDDGVIKTPSKIPSMSTSSSSDGASYVDMLYAVNDSNLGIPDRCPCGSAIIIQISTEAAAIPKKYFVCKDFKVSCKLLCNCWLCFQRFKGKL
ncbi:unnamed protein product, partial [Brassica rapa subsp. trilocularis]